MKSLTRFPTFDPNFYLDIQVNPPSSGSQENPTSWLVTSSLTIFTCKKQRTNFKYHFFILLPATHFQISIYTHQHRIIKKTTGGNKIDHLSLFQLSPQRHLFSYRNSRHTPANTHTTGLYTVQLISNCRTVATKPCKTPGDDGSISQNGSKCMICA